MRLLQGIACSLVLNDLEWLIINPVMWLIKIFFLMLNCQIDLIIELLVQCALHYVVVILFGLKK